MSPDRGGEATQDNVRRSASWVLVGHLSSNLIRFASNWALARIFVDDARAFGQIALVAGAMQLMQLFSDMGVWVSVVRSPRGEDQLFLRTAWTVQVLRGFMLCAIGLLLAPVFAWFYENPALTDLIRVSALGFVVDSFSSIRTLSLRRAAKLRPLALIDLGAQISGSMSTVILALLWREPMAMVVGGQIGGAVRSLLSYLLPGPRDGFAWDRSALRELFGVGAWVFVSTLLMFLTSQDRMFLGKFVSDEVLGHYFLAWVIAFVPAGVFASMAGGLLLPLASAHLRSGGAAAGRILHARSTLLALGGWSLSGLIGGGPLIAECLYPPTYAPVGTLLPLACVTLWWGNLIEGTRGSLLMAVDKMQWNVAGMMVKLAALLVTVPLGHTLYGVEGAILGFAASELPRSICVHFLARNTGISGLRQDLWYMAWFLIAAAIGIGVRTWIQSVGGHYSLGMAAVFVSVTAVWGGVAGRSVRDFWRTK